MGRLVRQQDALYGEFQMRLTSAVVKHRDKRHHSDDRAMVAQQLFMKRSGSMKRSYFPVVLTLLLAGGLGGCDETPTGRSQLALVPGFVMSDMGGDAFEQMRSQLPLSTDAAIKAEFRSPVNAKAFPMIHAPDSVASETLQKVLS